MNTSSSINHPAIVVVAYNRDSSLKRLLLSISQADFAGYNNVQLVISIDHSSNHMVQEVADRFHWEHGNKRIINRKERLGLRKHVLSCGDLSNEYGEIIILEDDLYVSSGFYRYAAKALNSYKNDDLIGGVSLYNYRYVDTIGFLFSPLIVNGDVYFVKFPSSSGQAWSVRQWQGFRHWLESGRDCDCDDVDSSLPASVAAWPPTSWKKSFARYLVDTGKYFAYPCISLTTNMGEAGQHWASQTSLHQVPILVGVRDFVFTERTASITYDQFFELESRSLNLLMSPKSVPADLEFDLFGQKPMSLIKSKMVVSSKRTSSQLRSFGMQLMPQELNIVYEIPGTDFHLGEGNDFSQDMNVPRSVQLKYHSSFLGGSDLVKLLSKRLLNRIISLKP